MQTTATTSTNATGRVGHDLRARREALGMTRPQLAARAECSLSSLGGIEAGAIPKHSQVLARALREVEAAERAAAESGVPS